MIGIYLECLLPRLVGCFVHSQVILGSWEMFVFERIERALQTMSETHEMHGTWS